MNKNSLKHTVLVFMAVMAAVALSSCLAAPSKLSEPNSSTTFSTSPVPTPVLSADFSYYDTSRCAGSQGKAAEGSPQALSSQPTITGVLLRNPDAPMPVGGVILYLGSVHFDAQGTPLAAGLDKQTAPRAQSDELGRFVFSGVPNGTYVLILDRVYEAFLLNDPTSGQDMLVKVDQGRPVDLGDLVYRTLPGESPTP